MHRPVPFSTFSETIRSKTWELGGGHFLPIQSGVDKQTDGQSVRISLGFESKSVSTSRRHTYKNAQSSTSKPHHKLVHHLHKKEETERPPPKTKLTQQQGTIELCNVFGRHTYLPTLPSYFTSHVHSTFYASCFMLHAVCFASFLFYIDR